MLAAGFAKQSGNLLGIKTGFPARKATGEEIRGYSLCVFIPYLVCYCVEYLSTKGASG